MDVDTVILEQAEKDNYYTFNTKNVEGLKLTKSGEKALPNAYKLFSEYPDEFELQNNTITPKNQVIDHKTVSKGLKNTPRNPVEGETFELEIEVEVVGELQLNDEHTEVINGDLEVYMTLYPN